MSKKVITLPVIELTKQTTNEVALDRIEEQAERIAARGIGKTFREFGWRATVACEHSPCQGGHCYSCRITFRRHLERVRANAQETTQKHYEAIVRKLAGLARQLNWAGDKVPAEAPAPQLPTVAAQPQQAQASVAMPADAASYFSHIYDRDPQIRVLLDAIHAAAESGFQRRSHVLCWGRPACGKTEVLLAIQRMLGADSVLKLDGPATTKAGLENLILDLERVPPVIILEEIEKCDEKQIVTLLGIMDERAEVVKTNARIGSIQRHARCLVLATANNKAQFDRLLEGALTSRFKHQIYFPRPSRLVMEKILEREIARGGGNPAWIKPALDYAVEEEKTNDPRRVLAILDGRDRLLDGTYQADLRAIRSAQEEDLKEA